MTKRQTKSNSSHLYIEKKAWGQPSFLITISRQISKISKTHLGKRQVNLSHWMAKFA